MTETAERFKQDCALRNEARALLSARYAHFKSGLNARSIGERVKDQALIKAKEVAIEATEVANDSRGVVVGTAALLLGWAFRKPLIAKAREAWPELVTNLQELSAKFSKERPSE
ncbi:MAG: hypothetical protein ABIQ66_11375 [Novosphingobium sp.]